jgi:hypothetical protein
MKVTLRVTQQASPVTRRLVGEAVEVSSPNEAQWPNIWVLRMEMQRCVPFIHYRTNSLHSSSQQLQLSNTAIAMDR